MKCPEIDSIWNWHLDQHWLTKWLRNSQYGRITNFHSSHMAVKILLISIFTQDLRKKIKQIVQLSNHVLYVRTSIIVFNCLLWLI